MTKRRFTLNRLLSMFLCLALLVSYLPAYTFHANAASAYTQVADPSTMDDWQEFFLPENGDLSTQNAGGVWTDKSVFAESLTFGSTTIDREDNNSFLVALSAIASNMTITGQSSAPTDTMLVLDVSGSMSGDGTTLVSAANHTLTTLLGMNENSRVGVILYSGTRNSNTNSDAAVILLPLGRYEISANGTAGQYLTYSSGKVGVSRYVLDSDTQRAPSAANVSKEITGATYIQKGVIAAMNEFIAEGNETTFTDPNVGTVKRMPILVLMSDGAPTLGSSNFSDPGQFDLGNGSSTSSALGFVNQLSAAYAKLQIEKKYDSKMLFYTLGVGIDTDVTAVSVLDPENTSDDITTFWEQYDAADVGDEITVYQSTSSGGPGSGGPGSGGPGSGGPGSGSSSTTETVTVTKLKLEEGEVLTNDYVTDYFSSNQVSDLAATFDQIISQIALRTKYYPTLVSESENHSGYISFVDKLSSYMEVKDIKGLVIDNVLFSGASLASNFVDGGGLLGTTEAPTTLGDNMVWSVMERLGLDSADKARALIGLAFQYGQFSYTDENNYSNYIGWYANAAGEFLGHWHENITTMPDPSDPTLTDQTRPAYIIKSYGYLGYVDAENGVTESDLMYATIQVRKNIETGEETVVFAIPASLIPVVSYHVSLDESGNLDSLTVSGATSPIHFIYEAGLREDINAYNLTEKLGAEYLRENTNDDGSVNLYVSQFEADNTTGYNTVNTYSYFNPARQNERYYYQENATVYADTNGTPYTGNAQPSGLLYRCYTVYTKTAAGLDTKIVYRRLSDNAMSTALRDTGTNTWYIPKGNVHVNMDGYVLYKGGLSEYDPSDNLTDTLIYANEPFVDISDHSINDTGHDFIVGATLGNNGLLTVVPQTGIKLSKEMAEGVSAEGDFTFILTNLTNRNDANEYPAYQVNADGSEVNTTVKFSGGKATVTLAAGESLYIGDMTAGQQILVQEQEQTQYIVQSVNGEQISELTITIAENQMAAAAFVNDIRAKGNLTIAKEVEHDYGTAYDIPEDKVFQITVTLEGIGVADADIPAKLTGSDIQSIHTDANGSYTAELKHGQQLELVDLPEGTVATVVEKDPAGGFTPAYWDNGVRGDGQVQIVGNSTVSVIVVNDYSADEVTGSGITVGGDKLLKWYVDDVLVDYSWQTDYSFSFQLQKLDSNGLWQTIATDQVNGSDTLKSFDFDDAMDAEVYTAVGSYNYRIIESRENPLDGFDYDLSVHSFTVQVTDADMNGKLEISNVISSRESVKITASASGWDVHASFTNIYAPDYSNQVSVDITKLINNPTLSPEATVRGFRFALYENGVQVAVSEITNTHGITRLILGPFEEPATYTYTLKELIPAEPMPGWTYSDQAITVSVVVEDPGDGQLVAKISQETASAQDTDSMIYVSFTNTYDPEDAQLDIDFVSKALTGRDLVAGEFTFEVRAYDSDEALLSGKNDANGNVNFNGKLVFDKVGIYYYNVVETSQDGKGVTVDKTTYRVTVTVTDNKDGSLSAAYVIVNVEGNEIVFRNTYVPAPVSYSISGNKTLRGKTLLNDEFTFVMTAALDSAGNIAQNAKTWEAKNAVDGSIQFPAITYSEAGTYYYVVSEKAESASNIGIRYDETEFVVTVIVSDNLQGNLVIRSVSYAIKGNGAVNGIAFVNEYVPNPTTIQIPGSKLLENKTLEAETFSFELYKSDDKWALGEKLYTVTHDAQGQFSFPELTFAKAGTYYYLVQETGGGQVVDGVVYDSAQFRIRITVEDNLRGTLNASMVVFDQYNIPQIGMEFVNVYQVSGSSQVTLEGEKRLSGRDILDGEFEFHLYNADSSFVVSGEPMAAVNTGSQFSFVLNYGPEHVGNTYYYVAKELNAGQTIEGVTYSEAVYHIIVEVEDNGVGGIRTNTTILSGENAVSKLTFGNTYTATPASVVYNGQKALEGIRQLKENDFTFDIYAADASFAIQGAALQSVQNLADGSFAFQAIALEEAKTYYFVIKENSQSPIGGVTYDKAEYHITVVVKDDGKGALYVEAESMVRVSNGQSADAEQIRFVNSYSASDVTVSLGGNKVLTGRELAEGEFQFLLQEADEAFQALEDAQILRAVNAADGSFTFDALTFREPGSYYFLITEDATAPADRVTYDQTVYQVTIQVSDNGQGKLVAAEPVIVKIGNTETSDGVQFINTFVPRPNDLPVQIQVDKIVQNKGSESIGPENFQFQLEDLLSHEKLTVKSDSTGKAYFNLLFTELDAGKTFYYKLTELNDGREYVKYSTMEYTVEITVVLSQDNVLVATVKVNDAAVQKAVCEFLNEYDYTIDPPDDPGVPDTGDNSYLFLWTALLFVSGGCMAFMTCQYKKKENE